VLGGIATVTVQVLSLSTSYSLILAACRVLHAPRHPVGGHGSGLAQEEEGLSGFLPGQEVLVVFSPQTAKFLKLIAGHHVKIHQPWLVDGGVARGIM